MMAILVFSNLKVVRLVIYVEGENDDHIEPHLVFQMYCEFGEMGQAGVRGPRCGGGAELLLFFRRFCWACSSS